MAALGAVGLGRLALVGSQPSKTFGEDFGPDWQVQKEYTLEVAEAMPPEKYSFRFTSEMRTFGELMAHLGQGLYGIATALRGGSPPAEGKPPAEATKENVVAYLKAAFDYTAASIAALQDAQTKETVSLFGGRLSMTRAKVCHFLRDHTTHHRAYSLPYLRMCGIEPPRYRFVGTRPSPV